MKNCKLMKIVFYKDRMCKDYGCWLRLEEVSLWQILEPERRRWAWMERNPRERWMI